MKKDTKATVCRMCSSCCPVEVEVVAGKLVSAQRKSFLDKDKRSPCLKLQAAADIVYSEKRLTTPLIRQEDGTFRQASWDEALESGGDTLHALQKTGPARSRRLAAGHGR